MNQLNWFAVPFCGLQSVINFKLNGTLATVPGTPRYYPTDRELYYSTAMHIYFYFFFYFFFFYAKITPSYDVMTMRNYIVQRPRFSVNN